MNIRNSNIKVTIESSHESDNSLPNFEELNKDLNSNEINIIDIPTTIDCEPGKPSKK